MNVFLKYLSGGSVIFTFNMTLAWFANQLEITHNNELNSNIAHLIVTEMAIVFAFFIHNTFTWSTEGSFFVKLLRFHFVSFFGLSLRFLVFFLMIHYGFSFLISTLAGIAVSMTLNFLGYDRFVFTDSTNMDIEKSCKEVSIALSTLDKATNYNNWIASKIMPYLGKQNIEAGAGIGSISKIILQQNSNIVFCEPSSMNRDKLKTNLKNYKKKLVIKKNLADIKEKNAYDCIYSSNVMEHIHDDREFINLSLDLLKNGGYFVAFVPAGYFFYSEMDKRLAHYRRYDWNDFFRMKRYLKKDSIASLKKFRFLNPVGAIAWFVKMKIMGLKKIKLPDVMLMDKMIPYLSRFDFLPLPIGQSILIVIQKK